MKSAISINRTTVPSEEPPNLYVAESAQRRLDALRSTVDIRLAALETALEDPAGAESLEQLILDLARVATEEAQATAARACVDTRLEADTEIGQVRAAAQAAVEDERAARTETTRALEQARQQIVVAERAHQNALHEARNAFEAERLAERSTVADLEREAARLQRALNDAHEELEATRTSARDLRRELGRGDEQLAAAVGERDRLTASADRLQAELAAARRGAAELEQARAAAQADLAAERTAGAGLRQAAVGAAQELLALGHREADVRSALEQHAAELTREREQATDLRRAHEQLRAALDTEQAAATSLRESLASAAERVAALEREVANAWDARARDEVQLVDARRLAMDAGREHATALAALESERTAARAFRQAAADAETRATAALEAERAAATHARELAAHAQAALASFGEEATETGARYERLAVEIERERRENGDRRRVQATLEAELQEAWAANESLQQAVEQAREQGAARVAERHDIETRQAASEKALAFARIEVQALRDELEEARTRVERLVGERADAEHQRADADARLTRAIREHDELRAALQAARELQVAAPSPAAAPPEPTVAQQLSDPSIRPLNVLPSPAVKDPLTASKPKKSPAAIKTAVPDSEWVAVRMTTRYGFREPTEVLVNGNAVQLCDLSTEGCQILSPATLRPNQAVKVQLATDPGPTVCSGKVVWAKLEAPAPDRPSAYRAGVQFSRPDEAAIEAFIINHGAAL